MQRFQYVQINLSIANISCNKVNDWSVSTLFMWLDSMHRCTDKKQTVTYPPLRLCLGWLPVSDTLAPFMPFYDSCWHDIPGARCVISACAQTPLIRGHFSSCSAYCLIRESFQPMDCGNDWMCMSQTETDLELMETEVRLNSHNVRPKVLFSSWQWHTLLNKY